ncbi:right-handed parallel beta-helix repeat-containing protein [Natronobeatus ordinarius]|uniref:right-handed parallel beta-helix repeat-containing protein n=1 Tax=Natronobeatus ordinarius TaxID=2963433 RepID=UPI0020CD7373|nr:right-handed parallel beta-helix repeat-containing protein [Natronobeatus ordinarius]
MANLARTFALGSQSGNPLEGDADALTLWVDGGGEWEFVPDAEVDADRGVVTADVDDEIGFSPLTVGLFEFDEPYYTVEITDTNEPVTVGETLTVAVVIENLGNDAADEPVELFYDESGDFVADTLADSQNVSVAPGDTGSVTLEWPTGDDDFGQDVTVEVRSEFDAATDFVTIEKDAAKDVAVVSSNEWFAEDVIAFALEPGLEDAGVAGEYQLDVVLPEAVLGSSASTAADDYDVIVVADYGQDPDSDAVEALYAELDEETGLVSFEDADFDGAISTRTAVFDDPDSVSDAGGDDAQLTITTDHPLFEGVGEAGETIDLFSEEGVFRTWFDGFDDGDVLGEIGEGSEETDGPAVGVTDDGHEVLLSITDGLYMEETSNRDRILANAVTFLAPLEEDAFFKVSELEPDNATVEQGETVDVSAVVTNTGGAVDEQVVELRIDHTTAATQTVELGGNETESVEFADIESEDLDVGTYEHGIFSDDSNQTGTLTIEEVDDGQITECTVIDEPGEYELTTDINATETCIEITADDVHFDGNNHTVSGDDSGSGVLVTGVEGVTVTNVTVEGWYTGVAFDGVEDSAVTNSTAVANGEYGFLFEDSSNNDVYGNQASENAFEGEFRTRGNDLYFDEGSDHNDVRDNVAVGNLEQGLATDERGIYVRDGEGNTLEHNTARDHADWGIRVDEPNTVVNNTAINSSGIGIDVGGDDAVVSDNYVAENGEFGIHVRSSSENTVVENNTIESNYDGIGIRTGAANTTVTGNTIQANENEGIILGRESTDTTLSENTLLGNENAGIHLQGAINTTLASNVVTGGGVGVLVSDFETSMGTQFRSTDTDLDDTTIHDTDEAALVVENDSERTSAEGLDIGASTAANTTLSFEAHNVRVDPVDPGALPDPTPPENKTSIDRYFEAEPTSDERGELLHLELGYVAGDLEGVDFETLSLWTFDADEGEWEPIADSSVDPERGVVTANVTEFSTFGAFATPSNAAIEIGDFADQFPNGEADDDYGTVEIPVEETAGVDTDDLAVSLELVGDTTGTVFDETADAGSLGAGSNTTVAFDVGTIDVPDSYAATVTAVADNAEEATRIESFEVLDPSTVSDCRVIDGPGVYELEENLTTDGEGSCIEITVSDVVLDGGENAITNEGATSGGVAIHANGDDAGIENVTVRTVSVAGWERGVVFENVSGGGIEFVSADGTTDPDVSPAGGSVGIDLLGADELTVSDVIAIRYDVGISLEDSTQNAFTGVAALQNEIGLEIVSHDGVVPDEPPESGVGAGNTFDGVSAVGNDAAGIRLEGVTDVAFDDVVADGSEIGFAAVDTHGVEVTNTTAIGDDAGFFAVVSTDLTLEEVVAVGDAEESVGVGLQMVDGATLSNVDVPRSEIGIAAEGVGEFALSNAAVDGSDVGIWTVGSNGTVDDSSVTNVTSVAVRLESMGDVEPESMADHGLDSVADAELESEAHVAFDALEMDDVTASFEGENVEIVPVSSPADAPGETVSLGQYVALENVSDENGWLELELHYGAVEIGDIDEETLSLWKDDDGSWSEVEGSTVDTDRQVVMGTVTEFTTVGAFGDEPSAEPSVDDYRDEETGVVETNGLREAISDWRAGVIDSDLLLAVVDAWKRGD